MVDCSIRERGQLQHTFYFPSHIVYLGSPEMYIDNILNPKKATQHRIQVENTENDIRYATKDNYCIFFLRYTEKFPLVKGGQ